MSTQEVNRIENLAGEGVNVAGLAKIEDTGKNICTAWVNVNCATTPPSIYDSYNVSSVTRLATGKFTISFAVPMDNVNYAVNGTGDYNTNNASGSATVNVVTDHLGNPPTVNGFTVVTGNTGLTVLNREYLSIQVFGGKA